MENIGIYQIIRSIGKGGMGEVFLAYDPVFKRKIALKRIRKDLKNYHLLKERFLKEARITGQFTHPGIISIYNLHQDADQIYYTMPYVQGDTLKQILRSTIENVRKKQSVAKEKGSIPALMPIFFAICQALSYAHAKEFIHRDLKPENILVGTYGEVVILDWGLAQHIHEYNTVNEITSEEEEIETDLTQPGKLVGTLAYMAPERTQNSNSTFQTDIYAIGVILFQILTLRMPFHRTNLKEFRKTVHLEKVPEPEEVAPYRDVPPQLSRIVKKCLEADPTKRYGSMQELIHDLKNYMEGHSDWFLAATLDNTQKQDWEFQENVLISRHTAITRTLEAASWVSIMISKASFIGNLRLTTQIKVSEHGQGIGFLLKVPESTQRRYLHDGYCLWLGAEDSQGTFLFRNSVQVMQLPELFLKKNSWHEIIIEIKDHHLHCSIDGTHRLSYIGYLPLAGSQIGILAQDANFHLMPLNIWAGSFNLQVSCLAVPDAFLANNNYEKALSEYRRIAQSFPGHAEGREAQFRCGITLLEKAKKLALKQESGNFFNQALEEFSKLHHTPGAPFEYLGKALVYEALQDNNEEIKCLEFALRRYRKHPLISTIEEQIVYRMHETAQRDRHSAYHLVLIVLNHLPHIIKNNDSRRLLKHLVAHWENLRFLDNPIDPTCLFDSTDEEEQKLANTDEEEQKLANLAFSTPLAFWLASEGYLSEIFHRYLGLEKKDPSLLGNVLFCLIELGALGIARNLITENNSFQIKHLEPLFICHENSFEEAVSYFLSMPDQGNGFEQLRIGCYLMQYALCQEKEESVYPIAEMLLKGNLSYEDQIFVDAHRIWALLAQKKWIAAEDLFRNYPLELLNQETTLLHPLFGCWLYAVEGEEIGLIHFSGVIDTPYPRTWALLGHQITNQLTESPTWMKQSFLWERRQLYRQLVLFYRCIDNKELENYYRHLEKKEYLY